MELKKLHFIYLTTNLVNGKKYIGRHHGYLFDNYLGSGVELIEAIKQFGKENFKREILYISSSPEENAEKEIEYIHLFNAVHDPNFYNRTDHFQSWNGNCDKSYTQTLEYRQKMSESVSGEKNGMYGKKGNSALNGKIIAMLDDDLNVVRIFNSKTGILEFLNLKGHTKLDKAIECGFKYRDYYWAKINKEKYLNGELSVETKAILENKIEEE